jgi:AhpC/TSA family
VSDHSNPLEPGTQAPDWELKSALDQSVQLSDFRGRSLIMASYHADWSPVSREDFMSGIRSGVNGTPTFFVNGVRHNGGYEPQSLLQALGAAL